MNIWMTLKKAVNLYPDKIVEATQVRLLPTFMYIITIRMMKVILGAEHTKDPNVERNTHAAHLKKLKGMINGKYTKLEVEMLLMALDGKVEEVIG